MGSPPALTGTEFDRIVSKATANCTGTAWGCKPEPPTILLLSAAMCAHRPSTGCDCGWVVADWTYGEGIFGGLGLHIQCREVIEAEQQESWLAYAFEER